MNKQAGIVALPTSLSAVSNVKIPLFVRFIFSGLLLAFISSFVDLTTLASVVRRSDPVLLGLATAISFAIWAVNSIKWQLILREYSVNCRISDLLRFNFTAMFYNLLFPGQVAGEVMKSAALVRAGIGTFLSAASVIADRVTGLLAIVVLGLIGVLASSHCSREWSGSVTLFAIVAVFLACITVASIYGRQFFSFCSIGGRIRGQSRRSQVGTPILPVYHRSSLTVTRRIWGILILSVVFQASVVFINYLLCNAFGLTVAFVDLLWVVAAVAVAQSLPLSIAGLGIREGTYITMLMQLGVDSHDALAVSLGIFAIQLLMATAGGLLQLFYSKRK